MVTRQELRNLKTTVRNQVASGNYAAALTSINKLIADGQTYLNETNPNERQQLIAAEIIEELEHGKRHIEQILDAQSKGDPIVNIRTLRIFDQYITVI